MFDALYSMPHIDLSAIGFTVAATTAIGYIVIRSDFRSTTNRVFLLLSLVTVLYTILNYFGYQNDFPLESKIVLMRLVILSALLHSFLIFQLFFVFPERAVVYPAWFRVGVVPFVGAVGLLTLTPYVFSSIAKISDIGRVEEISTGFALPVFGLSVIGLVVASFAWGIRKLLKEGENLRPQLRFLLIGATITYTLLIIFNFIFPNFLGSSRFVPFAPIFMLPFIGFTAYAILRHQLFGIKVAAVEFFVVAILLVFFSRAFLASTEAERIINVVVLIATFFFGILLIRSVKQEIVAREKIQKLANSLSESNWELAKRNEQLRVIDQRKSEFVSIVSHQLRTPITAIKGYTSLALEGSFGELHGDLRDALSKVFVSSNRLADMVSDFLDISKIEQGTMQFMFTKEDIGRMVREVTAELAPRAAGKSLTLTTTVPEGTGPDAIVDDNKMRQIFSNVIDNAIKYTERGGINVIVDTDVDKKKIIVHIKDTGIGLSSDDIHNLFGKFNRGSGGSKMDTTGSGLGLYVAKRMLEAHGGAIWVDSAGIGQGSVFVIEIPMLENTRSHIEGPWTAANSDQEEKEGLEEIKDVDMLE